MLMPIPRLLVALSILVIPIPVIAETPAPVARLLAALSRAGKSSAPTPNVIVVPGITLACSLADQRETRSFGFRKSHLVACGTVAGEVRGAVLTPTGAPRATSVA